MKHLKHCETSQNTGHSMRQYWRSMWRQTAQRHRARHCDVGACMEFPVISAIAELV